MVNGFQCIVSLGKYQNPKMHMRIVNNMADLKELEKEKIHKNLVLSLPTAN